MFDVLDTTAQEFDTRLSETQTASAEECRRIWREIVLQFVRHPSVARIGADWLLSFANTCPRNALPHANIRYVALNLLLYHYGNAVFTDRPDLDVFEMLNDIASAFDYYGDQSKQFSPIHKMSHVWGLAAIAYFLKSDRHAYLVCASMMRVSLESLGICFCSSGIESLYVLAQTRAPEFFQMMIIDPGVKLSSSPCSNYFRHLLQNTNHSVRYSTEKVHDFVAELFNLDASELSD